MFQSEWYTKEQLDHIRSQCNSTEDMKKLAKMVFGDNDEDYSREQGAERKYSGGQAAVLGEYDRLFAFGITTAFYASTTPNITIFKMLMDSQFAKLQHHLLNGGDVVIPKPNQQDINRHKERYYKDGQQVIFHKLGTGIASLPAEHVAYIQTKVDELRKDYARDSKTIKYYNYTPPKRVKKNGDDEKYQELFNKLTEMQEEKNDQLQQKLKQKQKELDAMSVKSREARNKLKEINKENKKLKQQMTHIVTWKWQDDDEKFKPYDSVNSEAIDKLENGQSHTFTFNGNGQTYKITKLTSKIASQINVDTNKQRSVKRTIKKRAANGIEYPNWWDMTKIDQSQNNENKQNDDYDKPRLYELDMNSYPAKKVVAKFNETCPNYTVIKVESMENQMLYDGFWNARLKLIKLLGEENLNTRHVFHGTNYYNVMGIVQREGFRKEFSSTFVHGQGTYFAKNARYSAGGYAAEKDGVYLLFLCKVIMGESHKGSSSYDLKTWPKKNGGKGLIYDSLVNDMDDPTIFVIHENVRAYPMFVIHYK